MTDIIKLNVCLFILFVGTCEPYCTKCEQHFGTIQTLKEHLSHSSCSPSIQSTDDNALFMYCGKDFLCVTCALATESEDAFGMHLARHNLQNIYWYALSVISAWLLL